MKVVSTLALGLGAIGLIGVLFWISQDKVTSTVGKTLTDHGLSAPLQAIGSADARLSDELRKKLQGDAEGEQEIDLHHPSELDLLFLHDTLRTGSPAARASAADALVETLDPRAVGWLARVPGTAEEELHFCSNALEILRSQTREVAAELMLDVLLDTSSPPSKVCGPQLEEKLKFINGRAAELLPALLESSRSRVQRYVLERLPPTADVLIQTRVEVLANEGQDDIPALAIKWLEDSPEPAGTPVPEAVRPEEGSLP